MDKSAVLAALSGATMNDVEMAAGDAPDAWRKLEDPFFPVADHDFNFAKALGKQGDYAGALRHHTVSTRCKHPVGRIPFITAFLT